MALAPDGHHGQHAEEQARRDHHAQHRARSRLRGHQPPGRRARPELAVRSREEVLNGLRERRGWPARPLLATGGRVIFMPPCLFYMENY